MTKGACPPLNGHTPDNELLLHLPATVSGPGTPPFAELDRDTPIVDIVVVWPLHTRDTYLFINFVLNVGLLQVVDYIYLRKSRRVQNPSCFVRV